MREGEVEETAARGGLRCPFCHDELDFASKGAAEPVVTCARCDAPQHVACVLESRGCAATGCGFARMVLGDRDRDLDELAALAADPARLRREALPRAWPVVLRASLLLAQGVAILTLLGASLGGLLDACTAVSAAIGLFALGAAARVFVAPPRRWRRETTLERQEALTAAGLFVANPAEPLLDELRASPVLPRPPAAALPGTCPHCAKELGEATDEDATSFCHHCGGWVGPAPAPDEKKP